MDIKNVQISALVPDDKNARKHNEKNIEQVMRSLKEFGQHAPLVVQKSTNKVLVGNGRLEAMKRLGWKTADVYFVVDDDETAIRRALADNRTGELAEWDEDILKELLGEFSPSDIVGWDDLDLEELLGKNAPKEAKDDDFDVNAALPEEPTSKRGDIFKLGNHRLMCGDSTSEADVRHLMGSDLAHFIFTDPPWNVAYGSNKHPSWKTGKDRQIMNDAMSTEDFRAFLMSAFSNMKKVLCAGGMVYVVMSAQEWGSQMSVMDELGFHWSSTVIWSKDTLVLSRKDYHTQYEPIWYGWAEGSRRYPLKDRKQSDVWQIPRPKRSEEHPTMKPVELVARAIQNSSHRGDVVMDLFGGSGTTMIAAEQLDRECRMMELDPKYCDVIIKRWEASTGGKAVLIHEQKTETNGNQTG